MSTWYELVASTESLLWERGYVGTSPKAIQQRAGAGQGSMYHHFAGKADLAATALRRSAMRLRDDVDDVLAGPGTAFDRITAYLRGDRDVLRGCRIGRLAQDPEVVASAELRAPVEETFAWLCGRLAEVLAGGQEAGELDPDLDPAAIAATIAAVLQGGYVLARAAGDVAPFDLAIDGALALLAKAAA
jgi:TetR/AcrR family transcriptional repressor of nem operon